MNSNVLKLLKEAKLNKDEQDSCFDFFILFSRFEYCLKRLGHIQYTSRSKRSSSRLGKSVRLYWKELWEPNFSTEVLYNLDNTSKKANKNRSILERRLSWNKGQWNTQDASTHINSKK